MKIHIKPFEEITTIDMEKATKESPLQDYEIPEGIFHKKEEHPLDSDNWDIKHWETVLKNRFLSVNRNFGYAMFYYYKGIPDDTWFASPGKQGQSVEYFPYFEEEHYSNFHNFAYFVDVFFLQSFTLYETIGHLLFKLFDQEIGEYTQRQISFNNAIKKIEKINRSLYRSLEEVRESEDYKLGVQMRNNIAHNHPPHHIDSGISKSKGVVFAGIGKYTTSNEIKKVMIGFLRSIKATFEVLEKHLAIKKIIKPKYTFLYCLNLMLV